MYYKRGMEIPEGYEVVSVTKLKLRRKKIKRQCAECPNIFWTRGDKVLCDKCLLKHRKEK